jgi:hypothetical protein
MFQVNLPKIFQPFYCENLIRVGKNNDGGYLVNKNDINQTDILISFGIGDEWSFENYFNCQIYAYDGQIAPLKNFDSLNRTFINKNVGKENKNTQVSISSILDKKFNVFLKCDIDGGEYQILDELIEYAQIFTGIVIEFHTISKNSNFNHIVNFISKIGMKLVHTHINNYFYYITPNGIIPDTIELTFSSANNLIYNPKLTLPHILDQPNNPDNNEIQILFIEI